jgi:putative DNA primase/helicase
MRRDWFTFAPSHTLWLLGNHRPVARAGGPAFWRRLRVLPFTRVVPPERQDKRLGEHLAEDAGGPGLDHQRGCRLPRGRFA